jgi:hypothetical protein
VSSGVASSGEVRKVSVGPDMVSLGAVRLGTVGFGVSKSVIVL